MADPSHRILIVDDEADTCANLADIFTDLGYQVDTAHDGFAALELVKRSAYDIALLDLRMPGMDGVELYRRIREISAGTVAIVVTAYASSDTAKSARQAGAWQILPKPVNIGALLSLVGDALDTPLILVVDDDEDIHEVTRIALRHRKWRGKPFVVASAHSGAEAREMLASAGSDWHVALVDVVMETQRSGLDLCEHIRASHPPTLRIVLRTGQPGAAPENDVLEDYDIDTDVQLAGSRYQSFTVDSGRVAARLTASTLTISDAQLDSPDFALTGSGVVPLGDEGEVDLTYVASRVDLALLSGFAGRAWGFEVWTPLVPTRIVDVSAVYELKVAALREHRSQLAYSDHIHCALGMQAQRSLYLPRGATYGEAFAPLGPVSAEDRAALGLEAGAAERA